MFVIQAVLHALQMAFFMFWEVLWPLALGFLISAIVQSLVPREAVVRVLGRDDLRGVTFATVLGAASSSCSYAAVAVARGLFRKGATFANAILFEFASTNLVFELGLVLLILLGWQFLAAEFAGGLVMIAILAVIFKYTLRARLVETARAQAEKGLRGRMEGHGEMDMSVTEGPFLTRLFSPRGLTAISHYFYMDVASVAQDLLLGFLIAGALAAWVPNSFWQALFISRDPTLGAIWGPIIGPVIPILNIYRKYYGGRMSLYLLGTSYAAMVLAGLIVGGLFQLLGLVPAHQHIEAFQARPSWNYTTILDLAALALAVFLGLRFLRTGGRD